MKAWRWVLNTIKVSTKHHEGMKLHAEHHEGMKASTKHHEGEY